ncbi:MAG: GldG family protein [Candidatus Cloacimonetes bacterium]|nr:GldG family protein [Candidatus Cloacimonadota bacterium]
MIPIRNRRSMWVNLLLLLAILMLVNLVSNSLHGRLDLTKGKVYKLSGLSRETLSELDDRLVVTAYFTRDLPPREDTVRDYALDLLAEYSAASGGQVHLSVVNPADRIETVEDARRHGIPHFTAEYFEDDKNIEKEVFMGLVLSYANHEEIITVVRETRGLEYEITLRIRRLMAKQLPRVAWLRPLDMRLREIRPSYNRQMIGDMMQEMATSPILDQQIRDELERKDPLAVIKQRMRLVYDMEMVDLWRPLDPEINCLIISAITDSLSTLQLYNLDQFFMRGGDLLIFQDRVIPHRDDLYDMPTNLFDLLDHWGLVLQDGFVMDRASMRHPENPSRSMFEIVRIDNFNEEHIITTDLVRMYLNFVSPIDTTRVNEGVAFTPLLFSSNESILVKAEGMHQRMQGFSSGNYLREDPKVLGGLFEGRFTSFFADGTAPGERAALSETRRGRVLLVGDTDCPEYSDKQTRMMTPNELFALNGLDYMHDQIELIQLRSRRIAHSPITWGRFFPTSFESVEEMMWMAGRIRGWKRAVKWINILLPSLLLMVVGIVRWRLDVRRRKSLGRLFE